jgi:hypothetical protein
MNKAIHRFKKCGIIPFNPLLLETLFIPDKSNGNEDPVTRKVSARKEPDGTANVQFPEQNMWDELHRDSLHSIFDFHLVYPHHRPARRGGGKAALVTSSRYQKDVRGSLDRPQKKNKQFSAKKRKSHIFRNPKGDEVFREIYSFQGGGEGQDCRSPKT